MLTAFGAAAVTFMVFMYALERRHRRYILAFALGCATAPWHNAASMNGQIAAINGSVRA
jgi:hypothetical protein